jgi:hypothetical protein
MDRNLPATRLEADEVADRAPVGAHRPINVAFLPLALVTFIVVAFVIAAWTFLASIG